MKIIAASIDLSKVDESRVKTTAKGQRFYPITIMVNDEKDKFNNDIAIVEGMTKEERLSGAKKKYIGNGKTIYEKQPNTTNNERNETNDETGSDLPF